MIKYKPKEQLLRFMAKKGFNQRALSYKSTLNPSTISNLLTKKRVISPTSARKIANALNCEIEDIFEIEIERK